MPHYAFSSSRLFPFSLFAKSEKGCPQWKDCLAAALRYGNIDSAVCLKRFIDWSHYRPENREIMLRTKTVIMREYPCAWKSGDEPYYPVNTEESQSLLAKYHEECKRHPWLVVGGRLGEYRYYDMDQSVGRALEVTSKENLPQQ